MSPAQAFDRIAAGYDRLWTETACGRFQREAFWRHAAPYFRNARRVLDIGCGTGEDAARLVRAGVEVTAIDVSPRMVERARARGVEARVMAAEELERIDDRFDAAMSNFGVLNCVADLAAMRQGLARVVQPGGFAILCLLGRFCLWETAWFLARGEPRKAVRRWRGETASSSGLRVRYPRVREIERDLAPQFALVERFGVGILVPPSFVRLPEGVVEWAARIDRRVSRTPLTRAIADHTLLIFRRNQR